MLVTSSVSLCAAVAEPPPDPGFETSVHAADVIAEVEILAGGPFRAVAQLRKLIKGEAPKVFELEGYNSYNWDTVHNGFNTGTRAILFLSRTHRADLFSTLTPSAPRLTVQPEGVMLALGDPPFRIPVKKAALEEGIALMLETAKAGKVPERSEAFLRGLWDEGEIESRYLSVALAGALRDPRASQLVVDASRDKLLKLRLTAVDALGRVASPQTLLQLRTLLRDEKPTVAREAARVLVDVRDTSALPDLLEWVRRTANKNATDNAPTRGGKPDADRTKTETVAVNALVLALEAAPMVDRAQISRALLEIARSPNDKLARGALAVLAEVAQKEEIPALIELADDNTYEWRVPAEIVLQRATMKYVRTMVELRKWWSESNAGFGEDVKFDMIQSYAKAVSTSDDADERRVMQDMLRVAPGEMAVVATSPLLLTQETNAFFNSDDLNNWRTPLALPYLIERLGRENISEARGGQAGLTRLCQKHPRLLAVLWPLIRAGMSDSDGTYRRSAQLSAGVLSRPDGMTALLDAIEYQGGYEGQDASRAVYSLSARTLGFSSGEPYPDQVAAKKRLRGWWQGAKDNFKPMSLYVPQALGALRIMSALDPAERTAKLEQFVQGAESRSCGAAFTVLFAERGAGDPYWKKLLQQPRLRDKGHALLGLYGSEQTQVAEFSQRLFAEDAAEAPLLRALSLVGLATLKGSPQTGAEKIVEWLRGPGAKADINWRRLAITCLGLADGEAQSLAFLKSVVAAGLLEKAPNPDSFFPEKPTDEYALLRPALVALCARGDSTDVLLTVLDETRETRVRDMAARALSLRRHRPAVAGILKAIERADRYDWHELCRLINPLLTKDDAPAVRALLDSVETTPRSAAAFLLSQRSDVGRDDDTIAALTNGLSDTSAIVRYYCADALGKRRAASATKKLTACLSDDDDDVRASSAEALALIGDRKGCLLAAVAAEKEYRLDNRWMRALALAGGEKQFTTLVDLCNSNLYSNQRSGLEALGFFDAPEALDRVLKTFRNDESAMQTVAADALVERGTLTVSALKDDLANPEKETRARALYLLSRIDSPESRAALNAALNDKEDAIKALAKFALEKRDAVAK